MNIENTVSQTNLVNGENTPSTGRAVGRAAASRSRPISRRASWISCVCKVRSKNWAKDCARDTDFNVLFIDSARVVAELSPLKARCVYAWTHLWRYLSRKSKRATASGNEENVDLARARRSWKRGTVRARCICQNQRWNSSCWWEAATGNINWVK